MIQHTQTSFRILSEQFPLKLEIVTHHMLQELFVFLWDLPYTNVANCAVLMSFIYFFASLAMVTTKFTL